MSSEHTTPSYDDVNTKSLALIGLFAVILVFVVIAATQVVYFRYEEAEFQEKVLNSENKGVQEMIAAQKARLLTAGTGADPETGMVADPEKKLKSIPISEAKELVITNYQSKQ